ncbi:hypothetical protein RF11_13772 [Thelohanellus kitauei]|uniref:Tc1-like transposase DDE domain-containing protein n=1 Tax=Thelohanellus kitauei TaxID=669202 RepID=A0A0C2MHQ2_THEKT|nr:hypothetical protein RF11_13772 [Thelohanellus kitauei]
MTRPIPVARNDPDVKDERVSYIGWYNSVPITIRYSNLIFVDESPFHLHIMRSHSPSRIRTSPNSIIRSSRSPILTMIIATSSINIVHCEAIYTTVTGLVYQEFLRKVHEVLGDGDYTIVMGNVPIHHSNQDFYDSLEYRVKYLPPYSPFINPCEEVFSQLENSVRRNGPISGNVDLTQRMIAACSEITTANLKNYFLHSESFFQRCLNLEDIASE